MAALFNNHRNCFSSASLSECNMRMFVGVVVYLCCVLIPIVALVSFIET